jgi:hypothetical protein
LAQNAAASARNDLFADIATTPAVQELLRRVGQGGALSCAGICASAQPFLAALIQQNFPSRPIVIVTDNLKAQESVQQDVETWLQVASCKLQVAG